MDLVEIGWEDVDCTHLAQDRVQVCGFLNTIMNLWIPLLKGGELLV
jgi:hypothetical protein